MSDPQHIQLDREPPRPYARVRRFGCQYYTPGPSRLVPLHWLHDWPRALQPGATDVAFGPVFQCFYSSHGFDTAPIFDSHLPQPADWDTRVHEGNALYNVKVLSVHLAGARPQYLGERHARICVVDDGRRLTVPLHWLERPWRGGVQRDGQVSAVERERERWCFYDPRDERGAAVEAGSWIELPRRRRFCAEGRAVYWVRVLEVWEAGEFS